MRSDRKTLRTIRLADKTGRVQQEDVVINHNEVRDVIKAPEPLRKTRPVIINIVLKTYNYLRVCSAHIHPPVDPTPRYLYGRKPKGLWWLIAILTISVNRVLGHI